MRAGLELNGMERRPTDRLAQVIGPRHAPAVDEDLDGVRRLQAKLVAAGFLDLERPLGEGRPGTTDGTTTDEGATAAGLDLARRARASAGAEVVALGECLV